MQLAEFATTDCTGLVLAHRQNFVGSSLAKGTVLTDQHVAALMAAGVETVSYTHLTLPTKRIV